GSQRTARPDQRRQRALSGDGDRDQLPAAVRRRFVPFGGIRPPRRAFHPLLLLHTRRLLPRGGRQAPGARPARPLERGPRLLAGRRGGRTDGLALPTREGGGGSGVGGADPSQNGAMRKPAFLLLFSLAAPLPAAIHPEPVSGDFAIRDFHFASGETMPELK